MWTVYDMFNVPLYTDYQRWEDVSINKDKIISAFYISQMPYQICCYNLYKTLHK